MSRPNFIQDLDIKRWSELLDQEKHIPQDLLKIPALRETCYAGFWLSEELSKLSCPASIIAQIQFTAGQLSYLSDPWEVHQLILKEYVENNLVFEPEEPLILN